MSEQSPGPIMSQGSERTQDVVERLREEIIADAFEKKLITSSKLAERLIRERGEAADVIAPLREEVERLTANNKRLVSNPADQRYWEGRYRDEAARVSVLEGALKPFAAVAKVMDFYVEDSMPSLTYPREEFQTQFPDEPRCVTLTQADFQAAATALSLSLPDSERRTAPETCPNCFNEEDCASVDVCRAVAEVYAPVNAGSTSSDGVSGKQRSPGQQPRPLQTEDAGQCAPGPSETLSPDVARADREAIERGVRFYCRGYVHDSHGEDRIYFSGILISGLVDAIADALSKGGRTTEGSEG